MKRIRHPSVYQSPQFSTTQATHILSIFRNEIQDAGPVDALPFFREKAVGLLTVRDVLRVVLDEGVTKFERLFNGVRAKALVGLLAIPRAFHPQFVQHIEQSPERL